MQKVILEDLGRIDFKTAWDYQYELQRAIIAHKNERRDDPEYAAPLLPHRFLFCEHTPVYTLGKAGKIAHLLLSETDLQTKNIDFYPINRGGDITFHGIGQVVGYPIFDLDRLFTDIGKYVRYLEEAAIRVCANYGIVAQRSDGESGAWLCDPDGTRWRKICAVGIHLSRWVTMHGFAFNVNTDLRYYDHIVPCGIADKGVTSLQAELGRAVPEAEVKAKLLREFANLFEIDFIVM